MTSSMTRTKVILVCDDDPDIAEFVSFLLRKAGHAVEVAHNHSECLARFHAQPPDLVILDVRMPEHDGFWVAEKLTFEGNKAPIMFMTAHDEPLYRLCAPIAGAVDYIAKPFDPDFLMERVQNALKNDPKDSNWFLQATQYEQSLLEDNPPSEQSFM